MEIPSRQTENIIEFSKPKEIKFPGMKSYKSFRSWIQSRQAMATRQGNEETRILCIQILNAYNHFHPEQKTEVKIDSWKGKSSFELIKGIDKLTIVKYQKPTKDSEPLEVRTEVHKEELEALIDSIIYIDTNQEARGIPIETKYLAIQMNLRLKLDIPTWKDFFANRKWHNKLTLMLGALDSLGLIEYKGGKTRVLNKNLSIQMIL